MENCPKCKSTKKVKHGKINGRQRYWCKDCGYRYTVILKSTAKSKETKKQDLHLYLEGLGFRSISRFLNVSHVSIHNWIRDFGKERGELKSNSKIPVIEMDEMHT